MIEFIKMNANEYDAFMELSTQDHIKGQIKEGNWTEDNAVERMKEKTAQVLSAGLNTPNHFFYLLNDPEINESVGAFWHLQTENQGQQLFFILDIQIYPEYKRCGYGTQAFEKLEEIAREKGISMIALSVFPHNTPAREMYKKLGYVSAGDNMIKQLG